MENLTAKSILNEYLPIVDDYLSAKSYRLQDRPFYATHLIVKHFVASIDGEENIANCFDKPWFIAFMNHANDWYKNRYKGAFSRNKTHLKSVVFIHNYPFELSIPYHMTMEVNNKDEFAVKFLGEYGENECWESYILSPPDLEGLDSAEYLDAEKSAINQVESCRCILHNTSLLIGDMEKIKPLTESIFSHINSAISNILNYRGAGYNIALWELHLAIEKLLKAILVQYNGSFPRTHDLPRLLSLLNHENTPFLETLLLSFPSHELVINSRYGDPVISDLSYIRKIYFISIEIILELSKMAKRNYSINGASFYMRRPKHAGCELVE